MKQNNSPAASGSPGHLTEVQFGELIDRPVRTEGPLSPAEEHLLICEQCTAELASLRAALVLFREAATNYADAELRRMPKVVLPARPAASTTLRAFYLAAAAALALAAFLPWQMLHQRPQQAMQRAAVVDPTSVQTYATESNDALLEDVDRATSASLPDSMQALADPTGNTDRSVQKSNPRKD